MEAVAEHRGLAYHWLVATVAVPSLLMVILDTTVVDVITPHMMAALNADFYDVQWVVISHMVAAAVSMPMFKRLYVWEGLVILTVTSLILRLFLPSRGVWLWVSLALVPPWVLP